VDAPVGTPVFVRLSDGASAISTLPVSLTSTTITGSVAVTNAGTFAVQDSEKIADNGGFTDGTTKVMPIGYIFDEVAGTALTENDIGASRMDSKRAQVGVIDDATTRGQRTAVSSAGALSSNITQVAGATISQGNGTAATAIRVALPTDGTGVVGLSTGANVIGSLTANQTVNVAQIAGTTTDTNSGNKSAGTQRIVIATDQPNLTTPLNVKETKTATNTTATVAGSASVVTLIASNANRLGATVYNDSSAILYLKLGASASTSDFTAVLQALTSSVGGYYEVPFGYTGIITGIWASATGNARVGELT
jgi:hypothetical protein